MLAFVRRRASADVADDLVADVFLIAWRRLDEVPSSDELAWLLGIARGALANVRRGEIRRRALRDRLRSEETRDLSLSPVPEEVGSNVARAIRSLSQRDQEVLLLIAWDELERDQAAKVLGVSTGAFAVRLYRARRRFARALAAEDALERADERSSAIGGVL